MEGRVAFFLTIIRRKTGVGSRKYFTLWWKMLVKSLRGNPYRV